MTESPRRFPRGIARARQRRALLGALGRTVAVAAAAGAGCSLPTDPPELLALIPGRAFSDVPVLLRANTRHVRPALRIDARTGAIAPDFSSLGARLLSEEGDPRTPPIPLEFADWTGGDAYALRLPAGIPEGTYALELTDARGATTVIAGAFTALGLDPEPPSIEVQPVTNGLTYGSGQKIMAKATADDGFGFLERLDWQVGDGEATPCLPARDPSGLPPLAVSRYTCPVNFEMPVLDATQPTMVAVSFRISARDIAGHEVALNLPLKVAKLPEISSFAAMWGALGGRQPFSVRGRFFLPGSEALLGGVPILGAVLTEHDDGSATISGFTPPRARAEPVGVEVRSPAGVTRALNSFGYLPPPRPRDIQPPAGPVRGGIRVTVRGNDLRRGVTIYVGATRETRQPLYNVSQDSDNRVLGCLPPGSGTVSVWAYDSLTGDGELPLAFTYQDPSAGGPEPPPIDTACR